MSQYAQQSEEGQSLLINFGLSFNPPLPDELVTQLCQTVADFYGRNDEKTK